MNIFAEAFFYFLITGPLAVVLWLGSGVVASILAVMRRTWGPYRYVFRFGGLLVALFTVGAAFDLIWLLSFPGRLYVEKDPIVAFTPLFPFMLDTACGSYFVAVGSWPVLQTLWATFALSSWLFAVLLDRWWHSSASGCVAA